MSNLDNYPGIKLIMKAFVFTLITAMLCFNAIDMQEQAIDTYENWAQENCLNSEIAFYSGLFEVSYTKEKYLDLGTNQTFIW